MLNSADVYIDKQSLNMDSLKAMLGRVLKR
jgi:hypothetical protein